MTMIKMFEAELEWTPEGVTVNVYRRENVDNWETDILVDALVNIDLPNNGIQNVTVQITVADVEFDG